MLPYLYNPPILSHEPLLLPFVVSQIFPLSWVGGPLWKTSCTAVMPAALDFQGDFMHDIREVDGVPRNGVLSSKMWNDSGYQIFQFGHLSWTVLG